MSRFAVLFALAVAMIAGDWSSDRTRADDNKAAPPPGKVVQLESKMEKEQVPDFMNVYGVPFDSVETLGARLVEARRKMAPLALAMIAMEMDVLEQVSGKKGEVTAAAVQKEAIEVAKQRRVAPELKAVALLIKDEATMKDLNSLAEEAAKEEADRIAAFKSGEKERGIHTLTVSNHAHHHVDIIANGHHLGRVPGHGSRTFSSHHLQHAHSVHLVAHDHHGHVWKTHTIHGMHYHYHWSIYP